MSGFLRYYEFYTLNYFMEIDRFMKQLKLDTRITFTHKDWKEASEPITEDQIKNNTCGFVRVLHRKFNE